MNLDSTPYVYDWDAIKSRMPHRYPFLFIDRVLSIDESELQANSAMIGKKVHSMKCVTGNELVLQGHFPDLSVMPGVLLIEMLGQCAMFALPESFHVNEKMPTGFLCKVDKCRFRSFTKPGDVLDIFVKCVNEKAQSNSLFFTFEGRIIERNTQKLVCEANVMACIEKIQSTT